MKLSSWRLFFLLRLDVKPSFVEHALTPIKITIWCSGSMDCSRAGEVRTERLSPGQMLIEVAEDIHVRVQSERAVDIVRRVALSPKSYSVGS